MHEAAVVIVGIILLVIIDGTYLTLSRDVYAPILSLTENFRYGPALLAWILIFSGAYWQAKSSGSVRQAAINGAAFGFLAYGIYNATNLATIIKPNSASVRMAAQDTLWGTILASTLTASTYYMLQV